MVELLLERGASVNATVIKEKVAKKYHVKQWGEWPHVAPLRRVLWLQRSGGDIVEAWELKWDATGDAEGKTPLHYAAQKGFKNVAEMLLAGGADINAKDNSAEQPRYSWAVGAGNKAIAELLPACGAAVNEKEQ